MSEALVKQETQPVLFTAEQQAMIRDSLASGAPPAEFAMLMEVAKARNLNPITRQIHFVKRWDGVKNREVWSYQVSIDGLRAIAERTGRYDGQDEPEFESNGEALKLARVRVYKRGIARAFVGVAYWSEYVQIKKGGEVTHMWATKPHVMLGKCAEALALRKAFPEDTSGLYTEDELPRQEKDITPPVRGTVADEPPHDPATGEVIEPPPDPEQDKRLFTKLTNALLKGFSAKPHKDNWAKKHTTEIQTLPSKMQDALRDLYKKAAVGREPGSDDEPPEGELERIDPTAA